MVLGSVNEMWIAAKCLGEYIRCDRLYCAVFTLLCKDFMPYENCGLFQYTDSISFKSKDMCDKVKRVSGPSYPLKLFLFNHSNLSNCIKVSPHQFFDMLITNFSFQKNIIRPIISVTTAFHPIASVGPVLLTQPWVGVTKPISSVQFFPKFSALLKHRLAIEYHVYIWQVSPQHS